MGLQYKDDCGWIVYSIHVAIKNLEQVKSQYRAHLAHSMDLLKFYEETHDEIVQARIEKIFSGFLKYFFRFFSGTFFERKKAIERAEINVDQLSGFMMPSGIISGSALDYLEGENPSEKSYDEIVQIIEQNVTRTTIQSIAMAKRNLFDLLKREIRSVFRLF